MHEGFHPIQWLKERFEKVDKNDLFKWGLILTAGLASLGSGLFDERKKEQIFRQELDKKLNERIKKLDSETSKD